MRRLPYTRFLIYAAVLALPFIAHAATIALPSQIFPADCNCTSPASAPDWGCVLETFQNVINAVIYLAIIFLALFIAYTGLQFMASPLNSEQRTRARTTALNVIIGIVIILAAWLLVNSVMGLLYNGSFGQWDAILNQNANDKCLRQEQPGQLPTLSLNPASAASQANAQGGTASTASNPSPNTRGDCSPSGLASDGMNSGITSVMSCITKSEDTACVLNEPSGTDKGSDGNSVSFGMFQINLSAKGNNLSQYPACEAAVNNQPLNCPAAFGGGAYTASNHNTYVINQSLYNTCIQAVSNAQCNVQVAQNLYLNQGGSKNWGTAAQSNCGG